MKSTRGQAMTEMVFLIPLLLMLAAGAMSVLYICWQGIKVQQAANLAARIQGQESVAGGVSLSAISQDNGSNVGGDMDPTKDPAPLDAARLQALQSSRKAKPPAGSAYGQIQRAVRSMFGAGEQDTLFIPLPNFGPVGYSDQVKVIRVWQPPNVFGLNVNPVMLSASAYGGEDPHMYGLVRWGHTAPGTTTGNQEFWSERDTHGNLTNLPNPNND